MKILMIITDAPYVSEHMCNALRLAGSLAGWLDEPLDR
jgi:sulfur relay (sulfurtransferase) complex TusBCD TusD component (DsrE family)